MNVTEDIKSHEQKEQGDTMQEADCAADTDSKFTSDGMFCTFGGHTCVPNIIGMQEADGSVHTAAQEAEVMSIEHWAENGRSTCVSVVGYCETSENFLSVKQEKTFRVNLKPKYWKPDRNPVMEEHRT